MASEAITQALAGGDRPSLAPAIAALNSPAMLTQITEALPRHMDADAFKRSAITLVKQNPKLLECDPTSVAQSIVRGASLGLDPDPVLGQMYLVPRNVRKGDVWISEATFQIGYKGLYELAMRTGKVAKIEVSEVRQNDHFEARRGSNGGLDHRPDWFGDRGAVVGWYAFVRLTDGSEQFAVLNVAQAEAHRDAYAPKKRDGTVYGPWVDNFGEMAEKTVFIKAAKWVPKSKELTNALAIDAGSPVVTPVRSLGVIDATTAPLEVTAEATPFITDEPGVVAQGDPVPVPMADENGEPIETGGGEVDDAAAARNRKMWALATEAWPDEDQTGRDNRRKGLIAFIADGATSSKDLGTEGWRDLFDSLELIGNGSHEMVLSSDKRWSLQPKRTAPKAAAKSGPAHRVQA
jgi:recombination protein RecT